MKIVLITAIGVGGATIFGSILGFVLKRVSKALSDCFLAFAAGVMLASAIISLILPSVEYGGKFGVFISCIGVFLGAVAVGFIDEITPYLCKMSGISVCERDKEKEKIYLFVIAIALHNLPEGIAAGVGFGTGDTVRGILIAAGIALQNIPEGMAVILPMMSIGISPKRSFFFAVFTGVIEIIGTLLGYFVVNLAVFILPFALAFAGGTMLQVVNCEMITEIYSSDSKKISSYALVLGFSVMLVLDAML